MTDSIYDPRIRTLLKNTEEEWGDPEINRTLLVPYGIKQFDNTLYGIDIINGELLLVMGQHKQRKTTFAINIVINYMTAPHLKEKPITIVDTLESGMPPSRYRDTMIANLASRWLMQQEHIPHGFCPKCANQECKMLQIHPGFLRYMPRKKDQRDAIEYAMDTMKTWPLYLFGAGPYKGDSRNLLVSVQGGMRHPSTDSWHYGWADDSVKKIAARMSRWEYLVKYMGAKIFISDHVQQFSFAGEPTDYEKQLRAVGAVSDVVAKWQIAALLLSQVSLTSVRESRDGGKLGARGGNRAAEEANVIFSTRYSSDPEKRGRMLITIEDSRKSDTFSIVQPLEDTSGAFYGKAEYEKISQWNSD